MEDSDYSLFYKSQPSGFSMFLWWLQVSLLFCNSVSKSLVWSFSINRRARSWILINESVLLEENMNFQGFQVFDFSPYTEIENSENRKFSQGKGKVKWNCFVWGSWNFQGFRVILKSNTCRVKWICFIRGRCKFPFPSCRFSPLYGNRKLGKLRKFSTTCKVK